VQPQQHQRRQQLCTLEMVQGGAGVLNTACMTALVLQELALEDYLQLYTQSILQTW